MEYKTKNNDDDEEDDDDGGGGGGGGGGTINVMKGDSLFKALTIEDLCIPQPSWQLVILVCAPARNHAIRCCFALVPGSLCVTLARSSDVVLAF